MRVLQIVGGNIYKVAETPLHRARIISELTALADGYRGTGWKVTCPIKAFHRTREDFAFLLLESGGIMAVSSQVPWFAEQHVLSEEWIGAGVTTQEAIDTLKLMATVMGFERYEVGTRATPGQRHEASARLYQRQGLRVSTIALEGVVEHGQQKDSSEGDGPAQAT